MVARSDLLLTLVRAGSHGDHPLFQRTVEALAAEERSKQHHVLANRLLDVLHENGSGQPESRRPPDGVRGLLLEKVPERTLADLLLPNRVRAVIEEIIEEQHRCELLRSYNLEPRHRLLLVGPPGNGKTSLAEALAEALMMPFVVVQYEGVIGSYLGETASRLRLLFDYVRGRRCVLFVDELEVLGKERGDQHETGEIKRVVSSLLLQIDDLPSHVVVVAATNHPELLDRAVWRRFQVRLLLPRPSLGQLAEWFRRFEKELGLALGHSAETLARKLEGANFSELEDFTLDIRRRYVLSPAGSNPRGIIRDRLLQWDDRFEAEEEATR